MMTLLLGNISEAFHTRNLPLATATAVDVAKPDSGKVDLLISSRRMATLLNGSRA